MPVLTKGQQRRFKVGSRDLLVAAVTLLFLLVGVSLLPLTERTFWLGSNGYATFVVAPQNGPGRGAEFYHVENVQGIRGRTFIGVRVGTWYWMGAFNTD